MELSMNPIQTGSRSKKFRPHPAPLLLPARQTPNGVPRPKQPPSPSRPSPALPWPTIKPSPPPPAQGFKSKSAITPNPASNSHSDPKCPAKERAGKRETGSADPKLSLRNRIKPPRPRIDQEPLSSRLRAIMTMSVWHLRCCDVGHFGALGSESVRNPAFVTISA